MTPLDVARRPDAEKLVGRAAAAALVEWLRERGAKSADEAHATASSRDARA